LNIPFFQHSRASFASQLSSPDHPKDLYLDNLEQNGLERCCAPFQPYRYSDKGLTRIQFSAAKQSHTKPESPLTQGVDETPAHITESGLAIFGRRLRFHPVTLRVWGTIGNPYCIQIKPRTAKGGI
jgi:hypothetical protein